MRRLAPALLVALVAHAAPAAATPPPGAFDRSFGGDGRVQLTVPGEWTGPGALAVQPDGKLLVAGTSGGMPFAARFLDDGELDPSFGSEGIARVTAARPIGVRGVTIDPAGRILLLGTSSREPGKDDGAVVRLLADGTPDTGFGSGGVVTVGFDDLSPYGWDHFSEAVVQTDGRIVVMGRRETTWPHENGLTLVVRLREDGTLDPSFDDDGRGAHNADRPSNVLLHPDGHVIVIGSTDFDLGASGFYALRFGTGPTSMPSYAQLSSSWRIYTRHRAVTGVAAELRPDGTIMAAGSLNSVSPHLTWLRIRPDLQPLASGARQSVNVAQAAFDARGTLITAGGYSGAGVTPFAVQRYRGPRLRHDLSFGGRFGRKVLTVDYPANLIDVAAQGDKVVVAGYTGSFRSSEFPLTLFRLHAHDDMADPVTSIRGLPRGCLHGIRRPRIRVRDDTWVRTTVRLDRSLLTSNRRKRFHITLRPARLEPGPHRLTVTTTDAAGNRAGAQATFRVCG
jgi:uncharacterized delta-60 repeat protein